MATKLLPKGFDTALVYECPNCGADWTESVEFTQKIGKILCGCRYVLELMPVKSVTCEASFAGKLPASHPTKPKSAPAHSSNVDATTEVEAITALTGLGWKRKDAYKVVRKLGGLYIGESSGFVQYVLRASHIKC